MIWAYTQSNTNDTTFPTFHVCTCPWDYTGFWVVEIHEPCFMAREPNQVKYTVMTEQELTDDSIEIPQHLGNKIVGTVAITRSEHSTHNGMAEKNGSKPEVTAERYCICACG
jgi:hypothetical protein